MEKNCIIKLLITCLFIGLIIYSIDFGLIIFSFDDGYIDNINKNTYDFIFLGNSMLNHNVNFTIFEQELCNLSGRKVNPLYITFQGDTLPFHYLIIKNRILLSNKINIPIIIIDYGENILPTSHSPQYDFHTRSKMVGDELEYYKKRGKPETIIERIQRSPWLMHKNEISASILREFINIISLREFPDGESILKKRFAVGQFKDVSSKSTQTDSIIKSIYLFYTTIKNALIYEKLH